MPQGYSKYTLTLTFQSSLGTPLQADTLFGHICWAIRFLGWKEKDKLRDFLESYKDGEPPPLLVSNGFPAGYVPKPIIPPVKQNVIDEFFGIDDRIKNSYKIKTIKEADVIPFDKFRELQRSAINPRILFQTMKDCYNDIYRLKEVSQSAVIQHNTIDRVTGRVRDGGLFSQEETFFAEGAQNYTVYIKTNYFTKDELARIFNFVGEGGYGRDKSTGKGYFTFEIHEGIELPEAENPNAFMTLSSFIPTEKDPTKGYYNIVHKFGKLGGFYAKGVEEVYKNPFKVPLIMFSSGSVFFDSDYEPGKFYGSLLKKVHQNEAIRHYAYAFPIGVKVEDNHEDI
jgi:CRISPR-associated protein Csm4